MKVQNGVWVVPYLNDAEFYGFILQGQPGQLVLALDPSNPEQRGWLMDAEKKMKQYAVSYTIMPYPGPGGDTSTATIIAKIRSLTPPFTVMVPRTTFDLGDPKDPVARAIGKAYGASVKPLPKTMKLAPGETLITPPPVIPVIPVIPSRSGA